MNFHFREQIKKGDRRQAMREAGMGRRARERDLLSSVRVWVILSVKSSPFLYNASILLV